MAWAWVAIGSAAINAGVSIYGASKANTQASRAQDAQTQANQANLDFQKQQYADWQAVYGPIRQNLSNFFQGLTPEAFAASGLKQYDLQYQAVEQNLQRSFAQRGLDSNAQDFLNQNAALSAAGTKATIRQQAPLQVANAEQGFLDHQVVNPASGAITNAYSNQADQFGNRSTQFSNQATLGYQAAGQAISGGITQYIASRPSSAVKP